MRAMVRYLLFVCIALAVVPLIVIIWRDFSFVLLEFRQEVVVPGMVISSKRLLRPGSRMMWVSQKRVGPPPPIVTPPPSPNFAVEKNFESSPGSWHFLYNVLRPLVSIRGEMSSGTSYLRELFKRNCPTVSFKSSHPEIEADSLYGWKHGVIGHREIELLQSRPLHSMVVISRNALPWIVSMHRMSQERVLPRGQTRRDFREFLHMPYQHSCEWDLRTFAYQTYYTSPPPNDHRYHPKDLCYESEYYSESNKNIMKVRTRRYKTWMKYAENSTFTVLGSDGGHSFQKIAPVRLEDLKGNTLNTFRNLIDKLPGGYDEGTGDLLPLSEFCHIGRLNQLDNTPSKVLTHPFDPVDREYIKYGGPMRRSGFERSHCDLFGVGKDFGYLHFLQNLDLEFERKVLGYEYPSNFAAMCQN